MKAGSPPRDPATTVRTHLLIGYGLTIALVFGLGGWSVATEISGAIITSGSFTVESNIKKVQHPTGGVVGAIAVREGQAVRAGDVVLQLDPTLTRGNLVIVENTLTQQLARRARLEAERDGNETISWPAEFAGRAEGEIDRVMRSEQRLFTLRKSARDGQIAQLRQRILQLEDEIAGQLEQRQAKEREMALLDRELVGVRELYAKNLIPVSRVTALERDAARLSGERGVLTSSTSSARGRVNEINLQILQIDQQFRSDVAKELREAQDKTAELAERQVAARDQLRRMDLRAPQDGIVHDLTVFTVGGVINPAETVMTIVPNADVLAVDVRIQPHDIGHVHPDQPVMMRLSAFDSRTTPEIEGRLSRIGADLTRDERSGASFYTARISVPPSELAKLDDKAVVPGMPVEAFIKTSERSVFGYLTKPFSDQLRRAFRGA